MYGDSGIDGIWLVPATIFGIIVGLAIGIASMSNKNSPSEGFTAVCEDRGGVVYGVDGCFNPDDAVYVEDK